MKNTMIAGMLAVCLLLSPAGMRPAAAQDPGVGLPENTHSKPQTQKNVLRTGDILGRNVLTAEGAVLGTIEDLVLSEAGRIGYLVMKMDERLIPIPWELLRQPAGSGDSPEYILHIERQRLANAPSFSEDEWRSLRQSEWTEHVHSYFGNASRNPTGRGAPRQVPSRLRVVE
ncbi:MAG: PRC-barrel domain containing protein [Desulfobacteraceae bacterium]|nr:MAG: PRC-barrel domain containing protein [Desulfobacteraceae bacterium]